MCRVSSSEQASINSWSWNICQQILQKNKFIQENFTQIDKRQVCQQHAYLANLADAAVTTTWKKRQGRVRSSVYSLLKSSLDTAGLFLGLYLIKSVNNFSFSSSVSSQMLIWVTSNWWTWDASWQLPWPCTCMSDFGIVQNCDSVNGLYEIRHLLQSRFRFHFQFSPGPVGACTNCSNYHCI